ncbi:hypothetical protein [Leptolyngbya sp. FACHB-16]|uniref:hypothetical protein n=1 Tax=unclassified Leptolyngbya TaxID=2650499 RepID=UPI0018F058A7|nr:hypothetical protein [Leptolyngbya sp. FACHB-16]
MLADERHIQIHQLENDRIRSLKSNEPLFLDDPDRIWQVQTGTLAIFAISLQEALLKGRRRFLFTVKAGELLFPASLPTGDTPCRLLAMPLEAVELMALSQDEFCEWAIATPHAIQQPLETWIHRLGAAVAGLASPPLQTPIEHVAYWMRERLFNHLKGRSPGFNSSRDTLTCLGAMPWNLLHPWGVFH